MTALKGYGRNCGVIEMSTRYLLDRLKNITMNFTLAVRAFHQDTKTRKELTATVTKLIEIVFLRILGL
jgi:hypothetical protein